MSGLAWVELDREAAEGNLRELRKGADPKVLFCAVVKSNAYGHGLAEMAGLLASADWFAVNSLEEALELKGLGISKPILILGHVPLARLKEAARGGMRLTLYNPESLEALARLGSGPVHEGTGGGPLPVHLKVETGTGRQGVPVEELPDFVKRLKQIPGIYLEGVSTHFANIEDTLDHGYAERQLKTFREALEILEGLGCRPPLIHAACTAAAILFPETHFNMLRVGIGVYGLWPSRETYLSTRLQGRPIPELKPVLSWKTRIAQLKSLPEGSYVGYGCTYRTTRSTRLAVLPVGYADGYDRALGNIAYVLVRGRRARVVGRVCMNLTMIDVTDIPEAGLEDEVVLLGDDGEERISAETLAGWAGTINYEIVARISPLLERRIVG